jgi:hypothetical protein
MKIARLQNWVYAEKNQTNNLWYYYVHPKRTHEVQRMIRADAESAKESAKEEATAAEARAEVDRREADEALNANIVALQNQLVANLARINEFDPDYVRGRPEMTPAGGVNVTWYRGESPHAQVEAGTTSNGSQP